MNNYGYMMPNMPNYYPAPFSRQAQGQPLPPPQMEVIVVHGQGGADAFQMGPNSSVLLLDDTAPVVWLKKTDGVVYATLCIRRIWGMVCPLLPIVYHIEYN